MEQLSSHEKAVGYKRFNKMECRRNDRRIGKRATIEALIKAQQGELPLAEKLPRIPRRQYQGYSN